MNTRRLTHFISLLLVIAGLVPIVGATSVSAGILNDQKGLAWASRRDLTSAQFSTAFNQYRRQGYMMIDVDAYSTSSGLRYSMVWQDNTDGRGWAEHRDMTSDGYHTKWTDYKARGYRPLDVEGYSNGTRWAGIWVQNREGFAWSSHRGLDSTAYGRLFTERKNAGFRPVDIEAYATSAGLRFAAIWYKNTDNRSWVQLRNMTREQYQNEVDQRSAAGLRVVDFESYTVGGTQRYAAIWERKPGFAWQTRTDRTELEFANLWRQYLDEGYRLVDFERYDTPDGPRYGGIWAENDTRYRYSRKANINTIVMDYLDDNDLPGISVAIVRDGQMLYRRGFGSADVDAGKVAHGETVYNSASVSKLFGGTLAAKLEDEGRLRNGTTFELDLTEPTSTYLSGMPGHHDHTVEQLLAHLGCVAHYTTTPKIANQTTHYTTALDAVESIWNTGLVSSCDIGDDFSYSTPGFTFAGAVLESVTGRTINQLLQNELFTPFGLSSTRVQYASATLPSNYERARPYRATDSGNVATSYTNSSWKVLGGGIESTAVDLARFGWQVLDGEILSADARDNRLWTRVDASSESSFGLAWQVTVDANATGRRVAQWNGTTTGARSFLRVYRDDGLVVAIMSNRTDHTARDVQTLATAIGNEVLR